MTVTAVAEAAGGLEEPGKTEARRNKTHGARLQTAAAFSCSTLVHYMLLVIRYNTVTRSR